MSSGTSLYNRLSKSVAVSCWFLLLQPSLVCVAQVADLERITRNWDSTQNKARSGVFEFSTRQTVEAGGIDAPFGGSTGPKETTSLRFECKFYFKGSKLRFEKKGPYWNLDKKEFVDENRIYVWDGEKGVESFGDAESPNAFITGEFARINNTFRPLQYAFRMNEPSWYIFKKNAFSLIVDEQSKVHQLVAESKVRADLVMTATYSVNERLGFSITHYAATKQNGDPTMEFDVGYKFDSKESVWVPILWSVSGELNSFKVEESMVTDYRLNTDIDDSVFEADLPADTFVSDTRKAGTPEQDYVLRANGEKRIITRQESIRATRQEIVNTESGKAVKSN